MEEVCHCAIRPFKSCWLPPYRFSSAAV